MVAGVEPKAAGSVPPQSPTSLVDLLGRNVLFATLAASVQAKVAERLVRHDFPAGAEIPLHRNGQGWLFILESGQLAAIVRGPRSGTTQIVGTLGPPDAVGISRLVVGTGPEVDYVALRPA